MKSWLPLQNEEPALNRLLILVVGLIAALGLYVLSIGPVFWLYGPEAIPSFAGKPAWVRIVYAPLGNLPDTLVQRLDDYIQWWMDRHP